MTYRSVYLKFIGNQYICRKINNIHVQRNKDIIYLSRASTRRSRVIGLLRKIRSCDDIMMSAILQVVGMVGHLVVGKLQNFFVRRWVSAIIQRRCQTQRWIAPTVGKPCCTAVRGRRSVMFSFTVLTTTHEEEQNGHDDGRYQDADQDNHGHRHGGETCVVHHVEGCRTACARPVNGDGQGDSGRQGILQARPYLDI